jgi:hypothetical protein
MMLPIECAARPAAQVESEHKFTYIGGLYLGEIIQKRQKT